MWHGVNVVWPVDMPEYCTMSLSTSKDEILGKPKAVVVGLTGGMGAGKSVVAHILKSLGHPVFDADAVARSLYDRDDILLQAVVDRFGPGILHANGALNRLELANVVFADPVALADLNRLVHPAVSRTFSQWKSQEEMNGADVVFREAAILYESGSDQDCDVVWAVTAPVALRLKRVCERNGWSQSAAAARMAHQWPAEKVNAKADNVLTNDGNVSLVPLVLSLLKDLL